MGRDRDPLLKGVAGGRWLTAFDLTMTLLVVLLALFPGGSGEGRGWVVVAALALPFRHRFPVPVALLACAADLATPTDGLGLAFTYFLAVSALIQGSRGNPLTWVMLAISVVVVIEPWSVDYYREDTAVRLVAVVLLSAGPVLFGLYLRARTELGEAVSARAELARDEELARMARDRAEDRNRLALELHDSLGHELSLIALQTGALTVAAPADLPGIADRIGGLARQAQEELRQIVSTLRDQAALPTYGALLSVAAVPGLIERFDRLGVVASLATAGDLTRLPDRVDRLVFRIVQESLTNVLKHAPGTAVEVSVAARPDLVEVTVINTRPLDGTRWSAEGRVGLQGLADRAGQLGGAVLWGPAGDGGWSVRAVLPLAETAPPR
ncbi:sensor histidine kinase [Actinocorallia longicatena]|uniref:histidine kinase n=1 Tax=Actinocorallia longicatena TaxID=111803 RepID=A0ABP6QID0_9ACTN